MLPLLCKGGLVPDPPDRARIDPSTASLRSGGWFSRRFPLVVAVDLCLLALRVDLVWDGGEKRGGARVRRDAVRAARSVRRF